MEFLSPDQFLAHCRQNPVPGPVAAVFVDSTLDVSDTIHHHLSLGFATIVVFAPPGTVDPGHDAMRVPWHAGANPVSEVLNVLNLVLEGRWIYWCFAGERLIYPYCETRKIGDALAFHETERRWSMPTTTVDLYPGHLHEMLDAPGFDDMHLDGRGYYALARNDPGTSERLDRQDNIFGGLRRRFKHHVPAPQRSLNRVSLFRADPSLTHGADLRFNVQELNTYSCPWHRNLTAATMSQRAAYALATNPRSQSEIDDLMWDGSVRFENSSQQLLKLGLIEPGQWF